ncbi:MAG: S41 family peptidase [Desulfobacteraceae bacterium]|nr:S41 family peptidase [Desulfobacteraceae bacterium]
MIMIKLSGLNLLGVFLILSQFLIGCLDSGDGILNELTITQKGNGTGMVTSNIGGIYCPDECRDFFSKDKQVVLTAKADEGFMFAGWGGDCSGIGECIITMDRSRTVTASFETNSPKYLRTRGNGFVIEIKDDQYNWFEVTEQSCFLLGDGIIHDNMINYQGCEVETLDYLMSISDVLDKLPDAKITSPTPDPGINFDVFWATFNEYYALFDLVPDLDWKEVYNEYLPRITPDMTDDELWQVFVEMISLLNDGHTMLLDFEGQRQATSRPLDLSPSYWMIQNQEQYIMNIVSYLDSFSMENNKLGNILFGTIDNRIGYMNVLTYDGYAEPEAYPDTFSILSLMCGYKKDRAIFPDVVDQIMADFSTMDALIIDLRFNMGGSGDLVLDLTSRLISERQAAYSYRVRSEGHDKFDDPITEYIKPQGISFLEKPIIVLTSGNTVSAGELQVMLLKDLNNVTVIGETTFGIFSAEIPRTLPNGWMVTLSTQRVYSAAGNFFEQLGIAPHVDALPDKADLNKGRDSMLEAALSFL